MLLNRRCRPVSHGRLSTCKCRSIGPNLTFQKARSEGDAGSFKDQVPTQLQKAEGLKDAVEEAVNDLVIVTHSCRSYLPITLIACQGLALTMGTFHQSFAPRQFPF